MSTKNETWIDWRRMSPMVDPRELDAIDRRQIHEAQQPATANKPILEAR